VKTKVVYETRKGSWAGSLRELLALLYSQKNHMINTFLLTGYLIRRKKILVFEPKSRIVTSTVG
jgi:hypothetical protein